ncbi:MAG: YceH family protein [Burkholderiaceae bacterium]|nr:YceH family protein [Burkholderiaceae bacterium]
MPLRPLSPVEARVLGTLMEKARTVPDSYPLTLNSLISGCNQKSSRDPLMNITDTQAQEALDDLKALHLVFETSGGRVTRYEHNLQRALAVPDQSAALLGLLMLRGPQTAGELRINAERWHRFADISSVEAFLDELHDRDESKGGPLVARLARAPGAREQRWAHLLCGPLDESALAAQACVSSSTGEGAGPDASHDRALSVRLSVLENEVAGLRATVQKLCAELGLSQPGQGG